MSRFHHWISNMMHTEMNMKRSAAGFAVEFIFKICYWTHASRHRITSPQANKTTKFEEKDSSLSSSICVTTHSEYLKSWWIGMTTETRQHYCRTNIFIGSPEQITVIFTLIKGTRADQHQTMDNAKREKARNLFCFNKKATNLKKLT